MQKPRCEYLEKEGQAHGLGQGGCNHQGSAQSQGDLKLTNECIKTKHDLAELFELDRAVFHQGRNYEISGERRVLDPCREC